MKILIVEDEEMIREGVSDYLTDCGYETIEAADGQEALEQFSSYEVALVLLDIQMPKLNGLEVLAEIRKTSQVPVLMLTAFQDEEYKMSAFASLADGYLEKPFSLSLLKVRWTRFSSATTIQDESFLTRIPRWTLKATVQASQVKKCLSMPKSWKFWTI